MKTFFRRILPLLVFCLLLGSAAVRAAGGEGSPMPSWYPADPTNFTYYHDETAPRVVDDADIFSDAQERQMETRLAEIRAEIDRDIVIYTDTSSYGLGHSVCAADFYDFNGYGCGDDREGVCLFVCMDPADRGWWVCCTGPVTRGLYTEEIANELDGVLYNYLASGDYAAGAENWIEGIRCMYLAPPPALPDWYPADTSAFQRFHNADAPRVVDDAGLLSASEIHALTAKAAEISQQYGMDILILTSNGSELVNDWAYHHDYYLYNGYGIGRKYDGIQLTVFPYRSDCLISGYGAGEDKLTGTNLERLKSRWYDTDTYYGAMDAWLDQIAHMLKTGRVPRSAGSWTLTAVLGALFGSAFGGVSLGGAKRKMRTPKVQRSANAYLAASGTRIVPLRDDFLGTSTSRRYCPPPQHNSSGSSSGGSSFSSSYSGSSGASHSGSGHRF